MLYSFFWVVPRRLNFMCRRLGTPIKVEHKECSEMSAHKIETSGNRPKEGIQYRWRHFLNRTTTFPFHISSSSPVTAVQSSTSTPLKPTLSDVTT